MFKKLLLCLVLAAALIMGPIGGAAIAAEPGQGCIMLAQQKVIQIIGMRMRPAMTPEVQAVEVTDLVKEETVNMLNANTDIDWTGSVYVTFEYTFPEGNTSPIVLIVPPAALSECK